MTLMAPARAPECRQVNRDVDTEKLSLSPLVYADRRPPLGARLQEACAPCVAIAKKIVTATRGIQDLVQPMVADVESSEAEEQDANCKEHNRRYPTEAPARNIVLLERIRLRSVGAIARVITFKQGR
eukprot:CAMPEP_0115482976 /NCGR_PEP_ID=MMETSP0271-20121206/58614_1 /TAXON_ID=71861 /ORGANISM="Scrippsiella trochoidea, Strain CCMP3099" /LENGTH=126 /DNA_ID=CAMNT_0002910805 /DNA_START=225 /DNA_END=601 /DNA_ORIENTATION=-